MCAGSHVSFMGARARACKPKHPFASSETNNTSIACRRNKWLYRNPNPPPLDCLCRHRRSLVPDAHAQCMTLGGEGGGTAGGRVAHTQQAWPSSAAIRPDCGLNWFNIDMRRLFAESVNNHYHHRHRATVRTTVITIIIITMHVHRLDHAGRRYTATIAKRPPLFKLLFRIYPCPTYFIPLCLLSLQPLQLLF